MRAVTRHIHRVPAGTKIGRRLRCSGAVRSSCNVPPDVQAWNERIEAEKAQKKPTKNFPTNHSTKEQSNES